MRFGICACPCQSCQSTDNGICPLGNDYNYADSIFLAGEEEDTFKVVVRRLRDAYPFITSTPFLYFTICIPMTGDIGSYHFTSSESPTDCYAFVKRVYCSDNSIRYYFWISTNSNATDIPFSDIDKTNYLHIYLREGDPVYYLVRSTTTAGGFYTESGGAFAGFVIAPTMNQNIPYIFWARPRKYQVHVEFTGKMQFTWCDVLPPKDCTQTIDFDYSIFNGDYIIDVGSQLHKYWTGIGYVDTAPTMIGEIVICGLNFTTVQYLTYKVYYALEVSIGGIGDGDSVSFTLFPVVGPDSWFGNFGLPSSSYSFGLSKDKSGVSILPCVDNQILSGNYGDGPIIESHSTGQEVPIDEYNLRCGYTFSGAAPLANVLDIQVIEWNLKSGCLNA